MEHGIDLEKVTESLMRKYDRMMHDGVTMAKATQFAYACLKRLYKASAVAAELPDDERRAFVIKGAQDIYNTVNPDIPGLPDMIESPMEYALLNVVLPKAYDITHALLSDDDDED